MLYQVNYKVFFFGGNYIVGPWDKGVEKGIYEQWLQNANKQ